MPGRGEGGIEPGLTVLRILQSCCGEWACLPLPRTLYFLIWVVLPGYKESLGSALANPALGSDPNILFCEQPLPTVPPRLSSHTGPALATPTLCSLYFSWPAGFPGHKHASSFAPLLAGQLHVFRFPVQPCICSPLKNKSPHVAPTLQL